MNVAFLKRAIKSKGMTQEEFAGVVGIGYATLKKYFRGDSSPTIEIFKKMCDVIGVDMGYALNAKSELPYEFHLKHRDAYNLLINLGYTVSSNPNNENEIYIKTLGLETYTTMDEITEKIKEFIQFEIYRGNFEQNKKNLKD